MNTFGRLLRISILGESHGECVGILIDGCPAGLALSQADFSADLARRKPGAKGTTARKESDIPLIKSGVFNGKTTGAPILILFENKDADSSSYEKMKDIPRPGHADFAASKKFGGFNDYRGSGHFSGRLTLALVAAGIVAKKLLRGVKIEAKVLETGDVEAAMKDGDSVGGIVECRVNGLPAGLGEPFFDSAESLISHIVFAIPAVKGIEFGAGFAAAKMKGSECNDEILNADGKTRTNNAGGINGGLTNGNELVFRVAVKPTSSIFKSQKSVNLKSMKEEELRISGRHDPCIAIRAVPVVENVAALVMADIVLLDDEGKQEVKL